jgi:hypothetical protein
MIQKLEILRWLVSRQLLKAHFYGYFLTKVGADSEIGL